MVESLWYWLATGLGTGLSPVAPGTIGSLLGIPLAWWLLKQSRPVGWLTSGALMVLAIPLCQAVSAQLGGSDHGSIVADEIVAFPLVVMGVSAARKPWVMAMAFVIYRFFDVMKPPPIHLAEMASGGLGIVLDDVLAAAVSFIVLALLLKWLPARWFRAV